MKGICNITSYYGNFIIENLSSKPNQTPHEIQTEDTALEFSKLFTENIEKNIETLKEQIQFTNDVFLSFLFLYIYIRIIRNTE